MKSSHSIRFGGMLASEKTSDLVEHGGYVRLPLPKILKLLLNINGETAATPL